MRPAGHNKEKGPSRVLFPFFATEGLVLAAFAAGVARLAAVLIVRFEGPVDIRFSRIAALMAVADALVAFLVVFVLIPIVILVFAGRGAR